MKRNIDRVLLIVLLSFVAGGIGYAIKIYIDFLGGGDSELVDAISDDTGVTGNIQGVGAFVDDFDRGLKRIRSRVDKIKDTTARVESRIENIERGLEEIGQGIDTIRAGIEIGKAAKDRLEKLIQRLQSEDIEGSAKN